MLVRCTSCNKPVFVSGSAVSGGEAKIACKACKAELRVTAQGEVTLLSGGAPAAAPAATAPAAAKPPAIAVPSVPQMPPATGAGAAAAEADLGLPPFGGPTEPTATSEPTQITAPPVADVTAVGPPPSPPAAAVPVAVAPAGAPPPEAEPEPADENTMIVRRPRAGQSAAEIELAPTDPAESRAAVRGPDPASYALGTPEQSGAGADEDELAPPRRILRVGIMAAGVLIAGVLGAWLLGFLRVPGLRAPGATSGLLAGDDKPPVLAMDASPPENPPAPPPTETPPPEPTPVEPTPATDNGAVEEAGGEGEEDGVEEEEDDGKGKKKKKGKLARPKPIKKPKKPAPERPAPVQSGGSADDHYQKASDLLKEKKVPGAIDELKKAIGKDSKHAKSYRLLGMAYTLLGKEKSAVDAFERFVKLDPGHKDVPKIKGIVAEYYKRNPK